jgi:hypothetical protein
VSAHEHRSGPSDGARGGVRSYRRRVIRDRSSHSRRHS